MLRTHQGDTGQRQEVGSGGIGHKLRTIADDLEIINDKKAGEAAIRKGVPVHERLYPAFAILCQQVGEGGGLMETETMQGPRHPNPHIQKIVEYARGSQTARGEMMAILLPKLVEQLAERGGSAWLNIKQVAETAYEYLPPDHTSDVWEMTESLYKLVETIDSLRVTLDGGERTAIWRIMGYGKVGRGKHAGQVVTVNLLLSDYFQNAIGSAGGKR
jgi:hypothetical protein